MRIVIQRVSKASVTVDNIVVSEIKKGLLVFLGITFEDYEEDIDFLVKKLTGLRIFNDENGLMNESVIEQSGQILVVSQFTLYAQTKKGNRPSYMAAARPEIAIPLYEQFVKKLSLVMSKNIPCGVFGAHMDVALVNDGPVTILIDSKNRE